MSQNTMNWLVENHVILSKIYDLDVVSLIEHISEINKLVNNSDAPLVHILWDFEEMATYPTNINDIRNAIKPLFTNERLGWVISISTHPIITFLAQVGSSMYGVRYRKFNTIDDAYAFLKERDPSLPLPR